MDILIKTGFSKITHNIEFQPETPKKGKVLAEAGRLIEVTEHRNHSNSYLIECKVLRQTSLSATFYTTKLWINSNTKVEKVSCNCVYNQSLKCKHVAALIYFINSDSLKHSKNDVASIDQFNYILTQTSC